jgi:hypothetical protein
MHVRAAACVVWARGAGAAAGGSSNSHCTSGLVETRDQPSDWIGTQDQGIWSSVRRSAGALSIGAVSPETEAPRSPQHISYFLVCLCAKPTN